MWRTGHKPRNMQKKKMKKQADFEDVDNVVENEEEEEVEENDPDDHGEDITPQTSKRTFTADPEDAVETPKKKSKKFNKELYRPPTAEEMIRLRETENMFHSNLFRLQIEEMLNEITIKEQSKALFENWYQDLKSFLSDLKKTKEVELKNISWLHKHGIQLPIPVDVAKFKRTFQFIRPASPSIVGSYATDCRIGPKLVIDIKIEIPKECLLRSDYQNRYYLLKRALYLAHLASKLKKWGKVESVKFSLQEGDPLKPVLQLVPEGALGECATITLLAVGSEDSFKLSQLAPDKANVKSKWLKNHTDGIETPTPHYNRSIAIDLTMAQNEQFALEILKTQKELRDGIMLLKVWLHQRGLNQGYGCFSGFIMSMFVLHLFQQRRLNNLMSSYQVMRHTWLCLAQADWIEQGISLADTESGPTINDFHLLYEVVFVDVTGHVNLCGNMSKSTFLTVKRESAQAIKCLDNQDINSFEALFLTPMPFYNQYDHLISVLDPAALNSAENKVSHPAWKLDCAGPWLAHAAIVALLEKGLDTRVQHIAIQHQPTAPWDVDEEPPDPCKQPLVLGLVLDIEQALRLIDKGPAANTPEAIEFRDFWGTKCELRRFRDGSICEAVVWSAKGIAERRLLCRDLVVYLAQTHLGLAASHIHYIADQFETVLYKGAGEEGALAVIKASNALGRQLIQLDDLPLSISSVQGSAPCLRYTDPFPPTSVNTPSSKAPVSTCIKASERKIVTYVAPIPMILTLALSGKWPDELQAIRRIKAAFYIKIAQLVKKSLKMPAQAYPDFVDVLKDGFVFRLQVSHAREVSLLKQIVNPQGQTRYKDNENSLALELATVHLPKLTSILHGFHMMHPAFGAASCMAKRWIAALLLLDDDLMPETCVELIMASLFLHPEPYSPPVQPQVAFLRFLEKLLNKDWHVDPIILNFNNEMSRQEVVDLEQNLRNERATLPCLVIATPDNRSGTAWTHRAPVWVIAHRLHCLAKLAIESVRANLIVKQDWDPTSLFCPSLCLYDVLVHLEPKLTRRHEAVDYPKKRECVSNPTNDVNARIPVVGLDLVQCYLRDLREAYDQFALFCYDKHGGLTIGILIRPDALKPREFKVSHIAAQEPKPPNNMQFNKAAFLDDLRVMGEGLVTEVQEHTKCEKCNHTE